MMFEFYLLTFLLIIVCFIVIASLKIGISPMPSSKASQKIILEYLKQLNNSNTIIDLGSGFGTLSIYLAVNFPNRKIIGYELSFFPWLISIILKKLLRLKNLHFYKKDFLKENIKDATLVCYLYFEGMKRLENKLFEDSINTVIISNTFSFLNIKHKKKVYTNNLYQTPIYLYMT